MSLWGSTEPGRGRTTIKSCEASISGSLDHMGSSKEENHMGRPMEAQTFLCLFLAHFQPQQICISEDWGWTHYVSFVKSGAPWHTSCQGVKQNFSKDDKDGTMKKCSGHWLIPWDKKDAKKRQTNQKPTWVREGEKPSLKIFFKTVRRKGESHGCSQSRLAVEDSWPSWSGES